MKSARLEARERDRGQGGQAEEKAAGAKPRGEARQTREGAEAGRRRAPAEQRAGSGAEGAEAAGPEPQRAQGADEPGGRHSPWPRRPALEEAAAEREARSGRRRLSHAALPSSRAPPAGSPHSRPCATSAARPPACLAGGGKAVPDATPPAQSAAAGPSSPQRRLAASFSQPLLEAESSSAPARSPDGYWGRNRGKPPLHARLLPAGAGQNRRWAWLKLCARMCGADFSAARRGRLSLPRLAQD